MANVKSQVLCMYTYLAGTFQFGLNGNGELKSQVLCIYTYLAETCVFMLMADVMMLMLYTHTYPT